VVWLPIELKEGNIHVSSSVFYRSPAAVPAANNSSIFEMPVRDTFPIKLSEFNPEMDDMIDSSPSGLGCVRAVRAAIVIEAASALLIYGIWALAHMHR
jgi:hypothetical protein